jgi:hypothetical protein
MLIYLHEGLRLFRREVQLVANGFKLQEIHQELSLWRVLSHEIARCQPRNAREEDKDKDSVFVTHHGIFS